MWAEHTAPPAHIRPTSFQAMGHVPRIFKSSEYHYRPQNFAVQKLNSDTFGLLCGMPTHVWVTTRVGSRTVCAGLYCSIIAQCCSEIEQNHLMSIKTTT